MDNEDRQRKIQAGKEKFAELMRKKSVLAEKKRSKRRRANHDPNVANESLSSSTTTPELSSIEEPSPVENQNSLSPVNRHGFEQDDLTQIDNSVSAKVSEYPANVDGNQNEFDMKAILEEYTKKLSEYRVALGRRDEVIRQLSECLQTSLRAQDENQAEASLQAEALAQEISILRQQLVQAREMLLHQKSSTGINPQELLEAQSRVLLLSQEASHKDSLIRDLSFKLLQVQEELEEMRRVQEQEKQYTLVNTQSNKSTSVDVEVQTDGELAMQETQSTFEKSVKLISKLNNECLGDSAMLDVLNKLEFSVQLQKELNYAAESFRHTVCAAVCDSSVSSVNVSNSVNLLSDFDKSFVCLNAKLCDFNSRLKCAIECVNSDQVFVRTNCLCACRSQYAKELLIGELNSLKLIYSNHLELQGDVNLLNHTFVQLQLKVHDLCGKRNEQIEEFETIKLLNEELENKINVIRLERDELKLLVKEIKANLHDASLLINDLRSDNTNLLNKVEQYQVDINTSREHLLSSTVELGDEIAHPFTVQTCVSLLLERLQKSYNDYCELNMSFKCLEETNTILNNQVSEFKEKFENEKQEKELLIKNQNDSFQFLPSRIETVSVYTSTESELSDVLSEKSARFDKLNSQYDELVQEKLSLVSQLSDMQSATVSLSTYEAAQQEIRRLERAEMRLCEVLEENNILQKKIDLLELDMNELLHSNSNLKKESNKMEQEFTLRLREMEFIQGELIAKLQETEMLFESTQSANKQYKSQLDESLVTLKSLSSNLDKGEMWELLKTNLIELAAAKQKLQVEIETKLTLEARVMYYKTKCEQLETLHTTVREQMEQIREQLQSVWNQQDHLKREILESELTKDAYRNEIISLRKKLEAAAVEDESGFTNAWRQELLLDRDSIEKETPGLSDRSSSVKELFEQDSINSSFDFSDSLTSEGIDSEAKKKKIELCDGNSLKDPIFLADAAENSTSSVYKNVDAHLQIALDLKDLHINDLQLKLLQTKMERCNQQCLQNWEIHEQLLEGQREMSDKNITQMKEMYTIMDSYCAKNMDCALKEAKMLWDRKHAEELQTIHEKHKKELENLMFQITEFPSNKEDERIHSLKHIALQVLESQKNSHLRCLEQELNLQKLDVLDKAAHQKDVQQKIQVLESENKTLKNLIGSFNSSHITESDEDSCTLWKKFISQLHLELFQHSQMVQSKWSDFFTERLNSQSDELSSSISDPSSSVNPVERISQLKFAIKEKETWLQVSSGMQEAVELYVEHLSGLKCEIENESTALLKLKSDIQNSLCNNKTVSTQTVTSESGNHEFELPKSSSSVEEMSSESVDRTNNLENSLREDIEIFKEESEKKMNNVIEKKHQKDIETFMEKETIEVPMNDHNCEISSSIPDTELVVVYPQNNLELETLQASSSTDSVCCSNCKELQSAYEKVVDENAYLLVAITEENNKYDSRVLICKKETEWFKEKFLNMQQELTSKIENKISDCKKKTVETNEQILLLSNKHHLRVRTLQEKIENNKELELLYNQLKAEHQDVVSKWRNVESKIIEKVELVDQLRKENSELRAAKEELEVMIFNLNEQSVREAGISTTEVKEGSEDVNQHREQLATWEAREKVMHSLFVNVMEKLLKTCIKIYCENQSNNKMVLTEKSSMVDSYINDLNIKLEDQFKQSEEDTSSLFQETILLDLDNFICGVLQIPLSYVSDEINIISDKKDEQNYKGKTDASTSTEDFLGVHKHEGSSQKTNSDQDLQKLSIAQRVQQQADQISKLEQTNRTLKQELLDFKLESESRARHPPPRDWLAGSVLSSVEIDSWQVHAAQTNSRLLHVLSDLVKTCVDTEQSIQVCLARLGLCAFQTSDSGTLPDDDGPSSGQFPNGSREDTGCPHSAEIGLTFEMCEDGLELTPRAWDVFASAFRAQDIESESDDVVLGASRRLRVAVDQILSLLSELMELQSLHDLSLLHQRNDELSAELKEEEKEKLEAQAQSLRLEGELQSSVQICKSLKEKLEDSELQAQTLWQNLESVKLRLSQLEVTNEALSEEKKMLQDQCHLLASGLPDTEQKLVAENTRLLGEKGVLRERQECERQQLLRKVHQLENALEETLIQREEVQERLGNEILDLKSQMDAMEKQLISNKKFIEEQGQEREQEREDYGKEIRTLKETLKERDRSQSSEVTLAKEVESLELQLRSKSNSIKEACERREELEMSGQQQRDRIADLQEVVAELEHQLEERTRSERELKDQVLTMRVKLAEYDIEQSELSERMSDLRESQMGKEQGQHIEELEEQLLSRNQQIQQLQNYQTLLQEFRGQVHVLDERIESKCRQVEHFTFFCSLSHTSSEDATSISDMKDTDDAILLIQEGIRVLTPISDDNWQELRVLENRIDSYLKATEELLKKYKLLEEQFKILNSHQKEVELERSVLQEQVNDQLLQISTLKTRLEEIRFGSISQGAKASVAQEMTQLREELHDAVSKHDNTLRILQETKSRLSLSQHQLQEKSEHANNLEIQLQKMQAQAHEHVNAIVELQDHIQEMKKSYEFKLQFNDPQLPKSVIDSFTQTEDEDFLSDCKSGDCDLNWNTLRADSSTQVGTPFGFLEIIPESGDMGSDQESFHSIRVKERLRSENQSLQRQNKALEEQNQLQKDFNTLQVMVTEKEEELTALTQDMEDQELLKKELNELHQTLSEKELEQTSEHKALKLLETEISSLLVEAEKASSQIALLKGSLESKSSELESCQSTAEEHREQADQLKRELDILRSEHEADSKSAESQRASLEQEICRLKIEFAEQTDHFQRDLEKLKRSVNRLEVERNGLNQALESTTRRLLERESQAQKNRRAMELKAMQEKRAHQEQLIEQMQQEHTEKISEVESQIKVLLAKLQMAREVALDKTLHPEGVKSDPQRELSMEEKEDNRKITETTEQVLSLLEEVKELKQQLLSERQCYMQLLQAKEDLPDSEKTAEEAEDDSHLLPSHIQQLCDMLLREGTEVLSLTENQQQKILELSSATEQLPRLQTSRSSELNVQGMEKDCGDAMVLEYPVSVNSGSFEDLEKQIEETDWMQQVTVLTVCNKEDMLELVKCLFTLEKKWLLQAVERMLTCAISFKEQCYQPSFPSSCNNELVRNSWWTDRTDDLIEKHGYLVDQLLSAVSSISFQPPEPQQTENSSSPEVVWLREQLESCKWQIQKQKELLEYSQQNEDCQRRDLQNQLGMEKASSSQLAGQLREWRKRCSFVESALASKESEVASLTQTLKKAERDLDNARSDLDFEKHHGQQLLNALESEHRNFQQVHAALYSERQRMDATRRRDAQCIKDLKSVLMANGLDDKVSYASASLVSSPLPSLLEPPELFRHAASIHSVANTTSSFDVPLPQPVLCARCSSQEQESNLQNSSQKKIVNDILFHQHPHVAVELLRLQQHHDSLCSQKSYLLRLLHTYRKTEDSTLSAATVSNLPLSTTLESAEKKSTSFRVLTIVVLSVVRLQKMAEVFKDLTTKAGSQYGGSSVGHQWWKHGSSNFKRPLAFSPFSASNSFHSATPTNGVKFSSWASASVASDKSLCSSELLSENASDLFSMRTHNSAKSEPEQRSVNEKRFGECLERLEFLHKRMGLDTN